MNLDINLVLKHYDAKLLELQRSNIILLAENEAKGDLITLLQSKLADLEVHAVKAPKVRKEEN